LATSFDGAVIALDARLVGYAAGIARYALLLAAALAESAAAERYLLLYGRRVARDAVDIDAPAMRHRRMVTPPHNRLERYALPAELLARRPRPTLLHSLDHVAPKWGPWRSVVTLHDLAFMLYPSTHTAASRAYYAATGESVRRAARVIAVSQRTASDAVRLLGVDPARVRVVHEAAAPGFAPRPWPAWLELAQRLGLAPDRRYLLFVGTLEPRKNIPLLLDAFALIRRELDVQLLIVGGRGWLDEPIFAAHARSGVGDAARFLGSLSEDDLAVLYSHAAAFVLPSLYEGFGLPVLEAMACGAPVVVSNAGPLPEVAGDAAVLLAPRDPTTWARAVLDLLQAPGLAESLRQRGFRRAARFSWARAAALTREVYREALLA
jgi:glycosyltransferase involved in cell wall biosynthesis